MSTLTHPTPVLTSACEALDTLAYQLCDAGQDELVRHVIGDLVTELETLAQASLGPTATDPTVVLLRRFARAHGRLLSRSSDLPVDQSRLAAYARAVREPAAALLASCQVHAGASA